MNSNFESINEDYIPFDEILLKNKWIKTESIDGTDLKDIIKCDETKLNNINYDLRNNKAKSKSNSYKNILYKDFNVLDIQLEDGVRENIIGEIFAKEIEIKSKYGKIIELISVLNKLKLEDFYKNPNRKSSKLLYENVVYYDEYNITNINENIDLIFDVIENNYLRKKIRYESKKWINDVLGTNSKCPKSINKEYNITKSLRKDKELTKCFDRLNNSIGLIMSWKYIDNTKYGIFSYYSLLNFYENIIKLYNDDDNVDINISKSQFEEQIPFLYSAINEKYENEIDHNSVEDINKIAKSFFPRELLKKNFVKEYLKDPYKKIIKGSEKNSESKINNFIKCIIIFYTYWLKLHIRYINKLSESKNKTILASVFDNIIESLETYTNFIENAIAVRLGLNRLEKSITLLKMN